MPHGSVVRVIDLVKRAGVRKFAINVESPAAHPRRPGGGPGCAGCPAPAGAAGDDWRARSVAHGAMRAPSASASSRRSSLHATIVTALSRGPRSGLTAPPPDIVELEVREPPPPPPPPEPPPPEPPEPPPPPPLAVVRRRRRRWPRPRRRPPTRSPRPSRRPTSRRRPPFGVTLDSVVEGDSPVAVPVGNTVMTKSGHAPAARPAGAAARGAGAARSSPVSELYIGEFAQRACTR